jgi:hypothetical protein
MLKMQEVTLGKYKHFKGTIVEVIGIANHSETMEKFVVYTHEDPIKGKGKNSLWIRPVCMFLENIKIDGAERPRFKYIGK